MRLPADRFAFSELDLHAPTAFLRLFGASMVNQYLAHDMRRNPQKMRAIPECHMLACEQAEVRFMNERTGLRASIKPVMPHLHLRNAAQFTVNQGREFG